MRSRPIKNYFRKHQACTWEYEGRGLKANSEGEPIGCIAFKDTDCGITETMPIHERTNTIPIGNTLLTDMKWNKTGFKFGSVQFIPAAAKDQIAPDKAVFYYPTMFHTYSGDFGHCEFNPNGNEIGEDE